MSTSEPSETKVQPMEKILLNKKTVEYKTDVLPAQFGHVITYTSRPMKIWSRIPSSKMELARHVLAEVPQQVTQYYKMRGIHPSPPVKGPVVIPANTEPSDKGSAPPSTRRESAPPPHQSMPATYPQGSPYNQGPPSQQGQYPSQGPPSQQGPPQQGPPYQQGPPSQQGPPYQQGVPPYPQYTQGQFYQGQQYQQGQNYQHYQQGQPYPRGPPPQAQSYQQGPPRQGAPYQPGPHGQYSPRQPPPSYQTTI